MKIQSCIHIVNDYWAAGFSSLTGELWNGSIAIFTFNNGTAHKNVEWIYDAGITSIQKVTSNDGKSITLISGSMTGEVILFELQKLSSISLQKPDIIRCHTEPVHCLRSDNASRVLSGGNEGKISLISVCNGKGTVSSSVMGHYKPVRDLVWMDNSTFLSSSDDCDIKFWNIENNTISSKPFRVISRDQPTFCLSVIGKYLALGQENQVEIFFDNERKFLVKNDMAPVKTLAFRPSAGLPVLLYGTDDGKVKYVEILENSPLKEYSVSSHQDFVRSVAWSDDGNRFVHGGWQETDSNTADICLENFELI